MADLPTNYHDDILSASMNGKKKFRLTYRNGTTEEVTIEDISEYDQYGSKFGAGDINKINQAINEKLDSDDVVDPMLTTEKGFAADASITREHLIEQKENLTASNGVPFKFGVNENGEYGYFVTDSEGADTFVPFKNLERDTPATATSDQITVGFTAWVNGQLIVGKRPLPTTDQTGNQAVSFMGGGGDSVTYIITFTKAFESTPTITLSPVWESNGGWVESVAAQSVTKTGFVLKVQSKGGASSGRY